MMLKNDEKDAIVKYCTDHCLQSFNTIYDYEKERSEMLWKLDSNYYAQSMAILYERFCYAMSNIIDKFRDSYEEMYGQNEAYRVSITLEVVLSQLVDMVFIQNTNIQNLHNSTEYYNDGNYTDEEYDEFWDEHEDIEQNIIDVRYSYEGDDRKWEYGFIVGDENDIYDTCNKDFLHIRKIMGLSDEIDVSIFLNKTKREYMPIIIHAFQDNV